MKHSCLSVFNMCLFFLMSMMSPILFFNLQPQEVVASIIQVTLNPVLSIGTVPPEFPGLGMEPFSVCALINLDKQAPRLVNMFKNLGPAILRFGGNTVENTGWSPRGTASCSYDHTTLNQASIDQVFSFARRAGLKIIWPVNLRDQDPITYSDEAAYAVKSGGQSLAALEIGNEPDLYGWSYSKYHAEWEAYVRAIKSRDPHAPISGPALCCNRIWFSRFMNDDRSKIALATQHLYSLQKSTVSRLMDPVLMRDTMNRIDYFVQVAKASHLSLQLDETDPFVDVDVPAGHSFAASLWVADYMLSAAEHGVVGVNIFGQLPSDQESPLNTDGSPRGTYYGVLFFHNAAPGNSRILKAQIKSSANIAVHATFGTDSKLRVSIINKSPRTIIVQINTVQNYLHASALQMTAPSINSIGGITLGGAEVAVNGTWSPRTVQPISVNGPLSSITMPASSAAIISYQKR